MLTLSSSIDQTNGPTYCGGPPGPPGPNGPPGPLGWPGGVSPIFDGGGSLGLFLGSSPPLNPLTPSTF